MPAIDQNDWHCRLCGQPLAQGSPNCRDGKVILSVLIPVHNESEQIVQNLSLIHAQASTTALPMEMIVIDDGSIDNTWQALEKMAEQMPELKALRFSRNFGKEAAICAGLAYSCGKACIVIDSDLQHPPELIPEMAHLWREEHWDIVEGIKRTRGTEPLINKIGARFFYRTLSRLSGYDLYGSSDFMLLYRTVIDAVTLVIFWSLSFSCHCDYSFFVPTAPSSNLARWGLSVLCGRIFRLRAPSVFHRASSSGLYHGYYSRVGYRRRFND